MRSTPDRARNLERAEALLREAARGGARVASLPEMFSYLGPEKDWPVRAEAIPGATTGFLSALARELAIWIVGGSVLEETNGLPHNTCVVLAPDGSVRARYRKIHLFDALSTYRESERVRPGEETVTVDVDGWKAGLSICYDLRFPELYRELSRAGADLFFVPAAFTEETGRAGHWETLLRARAIENLSYIVAAAQTGEHYPERRSWGRSMIVSPWGKVLASLESEEAVAFADLDRARLEEARRLLPALSHRRLGPLAR